MAIREKEQMQRDPHSTESIHVSEESERTVEARYDLNINAFSLEFRN